MEVALEIGNGEVRSIWRRLGIACTSVKGEIVVRAEKQGD
jgi:hypothetical protein